MPLLKVDGISCGYGDTEILRHVSMMVEEHEIVCIIGPNA